MCTVQRCALSVSRYLLCACVLCTVRTCQWPCRYAQVHIHAGSCKHKEARKHARRHAGMHASGKRQHIPHCTQAPELRAFWPRERMPNGHRASMPQAMIPKIAPRPPGLDAGTAAGGRPDWEAGAADGAADYDFLAAGNAGPLVSCARPTVAHTGGYLFIQQVSM